MQRMTISELSEPIRLLLAQVEPGKGIVVEDEQGRARYGIVPYVETTQAEKLAALKSLEPIQEKARQGLDDANVDEAALEREVLKDD